jgi:uncharacterized protein YbjT (DUF2867 family)
LRVHASEILVTGGTGSLGRRVVDRLRVAGHDARVLSRSGRPGTVRGDLSTGENLEEALDGIKTIIHCASNPYRKTRQTDVLGTERLLRVAERARVSHVVFISIVGVDRNPYYPYFRVKLDAERVIERSPVPWTILRATQFHDLVLRALRILDRLPILLVPKGFVGQPVDAGEVADRLIELSLSSPAGRVPDVGGPEVLTSSELARTYLEVVGYRKRLVEVPVPGRAARAWREGAQLCPDQTYGSIRWQEFLHESLSRQTSSETRGEQVT